MPICGQKSAVTIQKPMTIPLERGMLRSGERANGGLNAELLCVLGVQSPPAAELHGLGADDASNGPTGEKPLQHIEAKA